MAKTNRRQHGEGSLYQRKDGRWVWEQDLGWNPDGTRRRLGPFYGRTIEDVLTKRDRALRNRNAGFVAPKGDDRVRTLGQWMRHWLDNIASREVKETTLVRTYRPKVDRWIIPGLGRLRMTNEEINEDAIERFESWLLDSGLAPASVVQVHRILGRALKIAVVRGHLARNPCTNVTPPSVYREAPEPPSTADVRRILDRALAGRMGARWAIGLEAGPRQGEILALMRPYCHLDDLDNASIEIRWELARLPWRHGCADPHACGARRHRYPCPPDCPKARRASGRRHTCITTGDPRLCEPDCTKHATGCPERTGGGLRLTAPKSKRSRRTIPISRGSAELLKSHLARQAAERLAAGEDWTGWSCTCGRKHRTGERVCADCAKPTRPHAMVFTGSTGSPVDPRDDWQEWSDMLDELDIDHVRVHEGRHYAGTHMRDLGIDVGVVRDILGHYSAAFTSDTYQFSRQTVLAEATQLAGEALFDDRGADRAASAHPDPSRPTTRRRRAR